MSKISTPTISLVVPFYNESGAIFSFFERVVTVMDSMSIAYEIVCVNDGSTDDTLIRLKEVRKDNHKIKIIDLSRNFGKELALTAGLDYTTGCAVIPLDADLQDPPELIPDMVKKWQEGFDVVLAVREDRSVDSFTKRNSARMFYTVMAKLGEINIPSNAGDFRLMDEKVVLHLRQLRERARFMKGLFAWLGFNTATIKFTREKRVAGVSSWKYWRLWNFALEGIFSFSTMPLRVWTYIGVAVALAALVYMIFILCRGLVIGIDVPGYASLMVSILFFSGLNLICMGVLGEYLGRIFIEVKQRPLYIIRETRGFE